MFYLQFVFNFLGFVVQGQVFFVVVVVVQVFFVFVIEYILVDYKGLEVIVGVVFIDKAVGVVLLWGDWQLIEQKLLFFGFVGIQVELKLIKGVQFNEGQFVFFIKFVFYFYLKVIVSW